MICLENWSVGQPFYNMPPELGCKFLQGNVYNHPRVPDGHHIHTSVIEKADGRLTTVSGTTYKLGKINTEYRKWLRKNYPDWDWRKPVKIKIIVDILPVAKARGFLAEKGKDNVESVLDNS